LIRTEYPRTVSIANLNEHVAEAHTHITSRLTVHIAAVVTTKCIAVPTHTQQPC
jgi:hypothetical protein